ncbi:tomoregulin-1b isoform X3 [Sardina pilchardus]|uniref:tomoregulin-1b isoform X3 n=1 Tax=Sardina pilchardus TaxID=27697 RepID=UPI002E10108E
MLTGYRIIRWMGPLHSQLHLTFVCLLTILSVLGVHSSYPQSGECVSGKGKGCVDLSEKKSDLRVCDAATCRFGGTCRDDGSDLNCVCQFKCHSNFIPVCGSNGDTYQNECFLRQAACKNQRSISVASEGPCYPADSSSGSGDGEYEASGSDSGKKATKCGNCKYGAECDDDSEDVWCMCSIDCSGHNENPVCGTDGNSYTNPCHVREASCMKQEQIDVKHLGRCPDKGKKDVPPDVFAVVKEKPDLGSGRTTGWNAAPCSEEDSHFCLHGQCEMRYGVPSCRCESGYTGAQCDVQDFNILYVVPSGQKLHYVLIAAIIGAVQIAIIVAVVMCITRKCPKNNRGRRQKQNLGHFSSDTSSRMM